MQPLQIVSVIVLIKHRNKCLLVQRSDDNDIFPSIWQNFGGKVELGETVETVIRREVKEEAGLDITTNPVFLQSYSWKKDENSPIRLGLVFLVYLKRNQYNLKIKLDKELSNYGWFTFDMAKKMNAEDKLIGKNSPTGTLGQLSCAKDYRL